MGSWQNLGFGSGRSCSVRDFPISTPWSGDQWRSKTQRGPGSTVTSGPSLSLPSPFPSSSPAQPLPCREAAGPNPARGSGSAVSPKSNLVHFSLKIRHLVATILMIFLRVLSEIFLWPHYSGAPGARGPRFVRQHGSSSSSVAVSMSHRL